MTLGCLAAVSMVSRAWEVTSEKRQTTRLVLHKLKKPRAVCQIVDEIRRKCAAKKKDNLF